MIKNNKIKIIISSIIVLLPAIVGLILWNELPPVLTTHWGADGVADGFANKSLAVFGFPVFLLVMHFVCLLCTLLDKRQKDQNKKALGLIFWIMPVVSIFANAVMYRAAFNLNVNLSFFIPFMLGLMFIFMGNYLPKIKQNQTLGIKVWWALNNEENWNKTHRFAGRIWVACGFIVLLSSFLPFKLFFYVLIPVIIAVVIAPAIYSYSIYKKHQKEGISYGDAPDKKGFKLSHTVSAIIAGIILIGVGIFMFTGNIDVKCEDKALNINASYWEDLKVDYSEITNASYKNNLDIGMRTFGMGSAKLSLGIFENEELGSYTLYSYTGATEHIILECGDKTLVIGLNEPALTKALYDEILTKIE